MTRVQTTLVLMTTRGFNVAASPTAVNRWCQPGRQTMLNNNQDAEIGEAIMMLRDNDEAPMARVCA
eukprot:9132106-Pyramimonas_sp.AAC.1